MKTFRIIAVIGLLFCIIVGGCATQPSTPLTPEQQEFNNIRRVQNGVRLAVYIGVTVDLKKHPELRDAYAKAQAALDSLVSQQKWDALAFSSALSDSGASIFTSGDASLVLTTVPLLVDLISGDRIDLSQPRFLKPAMIGAADGLKLALQ